MTNDDLILLGFKTLPHATIGKNVVYDLSRGRQLSATCVGDPNEMLFLNTIENNKVTDIVTIHNYDYDGYLTMDKLEAILTALTWPKNIVKNGL